MSDDCQDVLWLSSGWVWKSASQTCGWAARVHTWPHNTRIWIPRSLRWERPPVFGLLFTPRCLGVDHMTRDVILYSVPTPSLKRWWKKHLKHIFKGNQSHSIRLAKRSAWLKDHAWDRTRVERKLSIRLSRPATTRHDPPGMEGIYAGHNNLPRVGSRVPH